MISDSMDDQESRVTALAVFAALLGTKHKWSNL